MQKTLPERQFLRALICVIFLLAFATAIAGSAEDYRAARAEMVTAYQAQDYHAMRAAALNSLEARPDFTGALFNLALAEVLNGDSDASLHVLNRLLEMKVDFGADEIDEFAPLHELPGWEAYVSAVTSLYNLVGEASIAYTYSKGDFVPEGIAAGPDGELYLGGIRHGDIVRIADESEALGAASDGPHWSVFGMRLADDGLLWFVSSAIGEFAELDEADTGKNGLFAIDSKTGEFKLRVPLPPTGKKQVLGDLILVDDDTIFLADQADGVLYSYSISKREFSILVDRGAVASPQGLVLDDSGEYLYVADYIGGLFRVVLATGKVEKVAADTSASDYGIDGLYRYKNKLIAIQNGIRPNRVVEFELSADGAAVIGSRILAMNLPEFDEPNLGVIRGHEFLFIANSHWNRFDQDGKLPDDLSGPIVLRLSLRD
jgi:sugar lactone lactonase YvrE